MDHNEVQRSCIHVECSSWDAHTKNHMLHIIWENFTWTFMRKKFSFEIWSFLFHGTLLFVCRDRRRLESLASIEDTSALVLRIITYHKLMTNVLCWKIDSIVLGNLKFCISKTWSSSFLFFGVFTPILHINYPKIMNSKLTWRNMVAVLCVKQWQMSACMARQRVDLIARLTLSTLWSVIIYFIFSLWETQR